jgi:cbb3-type cytochrome c oxidase subunit III
MPHHRASTGRGQLIHLSLLLHPHPFTLKPLRHMNSSPGGAARSKQRLLLLLIALLLLLVIGVAIKHFYDSYREQALLRMDGTQLQVDTASLAYASRRAQPLYQQHCASCHGADLQGDRRQGAPALADGIWLYNNGELWEIEQIILYGIRSGHPKAHNLTDMPAFGRIGQLSPVEIRDVVEFVQLLSQQPHDATAAERGRLLFMDRGNCYDCHESDGYGVADYGAPGLTGRGGSWLYGGDRVTVYKSIFDGRHGLCPAWINTLSFAEVRLLAAFIYSRSHPATQPQPPTAAGA